MPLALIGLLTTFGPQLLNMIMGPKSGTPKAAAIVGQVASVVQAVTGHDASTAEGVASATAAVLADPAKADALRVQLAQIAAQAAEDERKDDLAAVTAQLADVAGARNQTVSLAQAGSKVAWAAPVVSVVVIVGFFVTLAIECLLAFYGKAAGLDATNPFVQILTINVGVLGSGFTAVIQYWLGSSAGSARKDVTNSQMISALANSAPMAPMQGALATAS